MTRIIIMFVFYYYLFSSRLSRSFKSTRKGLVRNGESFKSVDTTTFMSAGSVRVYRKSNLIGRSESVESSDSSVGGSSVAESYYRSEYSVCLLVCLFVILSACLPACLSVCLPVFLLVSLSVVCQCPSVCLPACSPTRVLVFQPVCYPACLILSVVRLFICQMPIPKLLVFGWFVFSLWSV